MLRIQYPLSFLITYLFIYSLSQLKQSQNLWIILALRRLLGKHLLFKCVLIELNHIRIIRGLNICLNVNTFHLARHSAGKSPGADVWFLSGRIHATNLGGKKVYLFHYNISVTESKWGDIFIWNLIRNQ